MARVFHVFTFCLVLVSRVIAQSEGDACTITKTGEEGKCLILDKCEYAKKLLQKYERPQFCGFKHLTPVVCCPSTKSSKKQGKSKKQCDLYYPEPKLNTGMEPPRRFIVGGKPSLVKEFPHMAVLGYGDKENIDWLCGGSLISEQFVLTAAHCVSSQENGQVHTVRLGDLNIQNTTEDAKPEDFAVSSITVHPGYKAPSHYNDIALLKLDRLVKFNDYIKPICLYPNSTVPTKFIATGWGKLEFFGESSSHLMKVDLSYIAHKKCADSYKTISKSRLKNGIVDKSQLCAGDANGKDTCPGDSGGPLQIKVTYPVPYYYIVGITSFGKACGVANSVGVYTRVSNYLEWIEDNVWT